MLRCTGHERTLQPYKSLSCHFHPTPQPGVMALCHDPLLYCSEGGFTFVAIIITRVWCPHLAFLLIYAPLAVLC